MIQHLKTSLLYTVYLFGASALSLITAAIPLYIARALTTDEYIRTLVQVISMIISMFITIYILFGESGYRRKSSHESYKKSELMITVLLTLAIHFIIGLLSKYFIVLYFPVSSLGGLLIGDADAVTVGSLARTHFHILTLSYFLMMIPLVLAMILGFNKGIKKRKKERAKTLAHANSVYQ